MRSTVARASTRAHPPQNTAAVPHGLFDGHAHAGHLAARLGDEFQQAQNGLPIGEDTVYQENHVVPVQVLFRDPQGIGLLQREGVGFGRVDLRIDVPGLELLRIDRRDIQSSCATKQAKAIPELSAVSTLVILTPGKRFASAFPMCSISLIPYSD